MQESVDNGGGGPGEENSFMVESSHQHESSADYQQQQVTVSKLSMECILLQSPAGSQKSEQDVIRE
jgi:hypothetical protein